MDTALKPSTFDESTVLDYLNNEHENSLSWRAASLVGPGKPGQWCVWTENSTHEAQPQDLGKYADAVVDRKVLELKPDEEMPCLRTIFYLSAMPQPDSFPVEIECSQCGFSLTVGKDDAADVPGDLPPEFSARVALEDRGWSTASEPPLCSACSS